MIVSPPATRRVTYAVGLAIVLMLAAWAAANHGLGMGHSFTFLQPGFTQEIFGVSPDVKFGVGEILGGVAFAADGDPWVADCLFSGGALHRFDRQSTPTDVNGTGVHSETVVEGANTGCGLVNGVDGFLYSNTENGIVRIDGNTGVFDGDEVGSSPGNGLGIAVDPQNTDHLIYVGHDCHPLLEPDSATCTLFNWDLINNVSTIFAQFPRVADAGECPGTPPDCAGFVGFIDGINFEPTGRFLFMAVREPFFNLAVFDRTDASIVQAAMPDEPDGVEFHAATPKFVVTNNTNFPSGDGTMTRFDFAGDDYEMQPVQSTFASGGFRGDLTAVGPDGCIYATQAGTRYDNDTDTDENSLVRICEEDGAGFVPPPGVLSADVSVVKSGNGPIDAGQTATFTITVSNAGPADAFDVVVTDMLPPGTWNVSAPEDAGCPDMATGTLTCTFTDTLNPFAAGASVDIVISRPTTTADCGTLTDTVSVSASNELPPDRTKNSAQAAIVVNCPPPQPAACKMTGGGEFRTDTTGQLDSFGLIAQRKNNGDESGHFNLVNHATRLHVNGPVTDIIFCDAVTHTIEFTGTYPGAKGGCMFTVKVQDNSEPGNSTAGGNDQLLAVTLTCNDPNQVTPPNQVTLLHGNLQFHPTH